MEFTAFELITAIFVTAAFILSVIAVYRTLGDAPATQRIKDFQADRDNITVLEAGYQEHVPENVQIRFQDAKDFLRLVAKFTVIESDDAAVDLIEDIITPDAPTETTKTTPLA